MKDHADLIARLEGATGPDRELDALIACAVPETLNIDDVSECSGFRPSAAGTVYYFRVGSKALMSTSGADIKPFTSSLDSALALVSEKLAGRIGPIELSIAGSGLCLIGSDDPCGWAVQAFGHTPALAVLIAMLKALRALEAQKP